MKNSMNGLPFCSVIASLRQDLNSQRTESIMGLGNSSDGSWDLGDELFIAVMSNVRVADRIGVSSVGSENFDNTKAKLRQALRQDKVVCSEERVFLPYPTLRRATRFTKGAYHVFTKH